MKKYLLFAWQHFSARGGIQDYLKSFDEIDQAKNHFEYELRDGKFKYTNSCSLTGEIVIIEKEEFVPVSSYGRWHFEDPHWVDQKC